MQPEGFVIPPWAAGVTLTVVLAVLAFAWRLAEKANASADKIEAAVKRLESLEARISVISTLEKGQALIEQKLNHFEHMQAAQETNISKLRERSHTQASEMLKLENADSALRKDLDHVVEQLRRSNT